MTFGFGILLLILKNNFVTTQVTKKAVFADTAKTGSIQICSIRFRKEG